MSMAREMAYGLKMLIKDQGRTLTLRQATTLPGSNPAPNPPIYERLVVDGDWAAGAAAIAMRAVSLTGRLVPGDRFTIAGSLQVYTVTAQAISPTISDELPEVLINPPLVADAIDGAPVSITRFASDTEIRAAVTNLPERLRPMTTATGEDSKVRFLSGRGIPAPRIGDLMLPIGKVTQADELQMQGVVYGYSCVVHR